MKCLSVRQPWAWAIFHGKDVENRTWETKHRGPLLIHAALKFDHVGYNWLKNRENWLNVQIPSCVGPESLLYTFGSVIGRVDMTGCIIKSASPWFFGPYGFTFRNPVLFKQPLPYRGKLKIFDVPDAVINERLGGINE